LLIVSVSCPPCFRLAARLYRFRHRFSLCDERSALAEQIGQERDAFRNTGRISLSPRPKDDVRKYRKALQRAEDDCRRAFDAAAKVDRECGDLPAVEAWERLFLATANLEAFPDRWRLDGITGEDHGRGSICLSRSGCD